MAIFLILILGLILRLINLNQSFWLDEAVQAITSKGTFLNLFAELQGDFHPPLYHLLMWGWAHLFGNGEIVMRLPSVFFGTATILVVYKIVRGWESGVRRKETGVRRREIGVKNQNSELQTQNSALRTLPLIAALFLATAPFHIYYSQEARTYAMTAFFATLSMYYFIRLVRSQSLELNTQNLKYVLFTTLMLYSDYYGLFVFLAQIIAAVAILRKNFSISSLRETRFCQRQVLIFLLFLPCLPLLWVQIKTGSQATAFLPEWGRLVNLSFLKALPLTFIKFSIGRITIFNKTSYAFVSAFLLIVYGLIFIKGFLKGRKFFINYLRWVILLWFLIPVVIAWLSSFFIPNYQPFRLLLVLPAFYLLLALGISGISSVKIGTMAIAFIILVNLISLGSYFKNPFFHREDWRGAVGYIESQDGNSSLALIPSEASHWPYTYYSKGKVPLLGVAKGFNKVGSQEIGDRSQEIGDRSQESKLRTPDSELSTRYSHIYYIYYLADLFDPQGLIPNWLESEKFVKIREVSFNQIRIQEWERNE